MKMTESFFDRITKNKTAHTPDVLSCLANLSNDEVFTPPEVVNKMLDMLPQELFESPDTTFLDPACKTGVFLREIAKRLLVGLEDKIPDLQERIDHIFHKQLYGISIDLLVLTHNFDFYRTVKLRLWVQRPNCYIAQRSEDGAITMNVFRYQKDFFKQVIIEKIKTGVIDTDEKKKLLISSIPFYRNLCEYSGDDNDYLKLTSFLHLKTTPIDTGTVMLSDLWNIINEFIPTSPTFSGGDEKYIDALIRIADLCVADNNSEVILENKLVISIAIRQRTEKFLKDLAASNGLTLTDSDSNQTRDWGNSVSQFLTGEQKSVLDEVNLITPENIHLNSFMYEPIIDISDWSLKQLYNDVKSKLV